MPQASDDSVTIGYSLRLNALREAVAQQEADAFLVPTQDRYLSEYPPASAQRLAWLSGFDGSAGCALVLREPVDGKPAALFTDGRYTLQAAQQVDTALYHVLDTAEYSPAAWLADRQPGARLGYDPWLHPASQIRAMEKEAVLRPLETNPLEALWQDRPAEPCEPMRHHTLDYAGEASASKRERLAAMLKQRGAQAAFLGLPDGINWLLNIRGSDIPFNPLMLCYALLEASGRVRLMSHARDVGMDELHEVEWLNIRDFMAAPQAVLGEYGSLMLDPAASVQAVWQAARQAGCEVIEVPDVTLLPKAIKNTMEIQGIREAHRRDGRALSRFLDWFNMQDDMDERGAAAKLEQFRREESGALYHGPSFETISGSGPNGAIVHYRVTEASNRRIGDGELYLVDSGGQYPDGTTDVTRTVVKGEPTAEMADRYTRVLKGHIALAMAVFPRGTTGAQLDALARYWLWQAGLDYAHGTGHGVGAYLCVHEGPQRIGKRGGDVALQPGMVLSNEPGYYKEGEYGIRIENLMLVCEAETEGFLAFETLTLAPMDTRLIDETLLSDVERGWLAAYHARVAASLAE